jgi:hypothetical protein
MSINEFPRLINEVIRGTYRHQKIKTLRSASERTNSTAKEDFSILHKPKVRGIRHAAVLSQIAVIVVLLKMIARFISKVTIASRRNPDNHTHSHRHSIFGPKVPNFLRNLIQRE